MSITFKEILNKYNIKEEDFFKNVKESTELKSDSFSGLTLRQTKSLYKEISLYYSSINKTTNSLQNLKNYSETKLQNNIIYKTEEPEVNQILEGGFKGGYMYKIIGPSETGKTTLINSLIRANIKKKNIKILFFSFINDNIDYDLLTQIESAQNCNLKIVENIKNFNELLLSEYFKNKGEKLKNYNIIIFDPFTILLYKGAYVDYSLLNDFNDIINTLSWKNNICFIFSLYCRKLGNTFWYYKNDQGNIERLILRNYENIEILHNLPNLVKIHLYKMKKNKVIKYYMKVTSSCFNHASNFIDWELNSQ
jgi:hypothetical protein